MGACEACELGLGWAIEYVDEHGDRWVSDHRSYDAAMAFVASTVASDGRSLVGIHVPEGVLA